jgi:hypothetical protein
VLDGKAGTDTLLGGDGNDVFVYDAADASVNGGTGEDTLALKGFNQRLNLTQVDNGLYQGIEAIDLAGRGRNGLTLNVQDVLDISGTTDTLRVDGSTTSSVTSLGQGWVAGGISSLNGTTYQHYTSGGATLLIDTDVMFTY